MRFQNGEEIRLQNTLWLNIEFCAYNLNYLYYKSMYKVTNMCHLVIRDMISTCLCLQTVVSIQLFKEFLFLKISA